MNSFDNLISPPSPPLDDLVSSAPVSKNAGLSKEAISNRAATVAFMSNNSSQALKDYDLMVAEASQGDDTTLSILQEDITQQNSQMDMQAMVGILSDPSVDDATKVNAVKVVQEKQIQTDNFENLTTKSLIAPSEGENVDEEAARISTADMLAEFRADRETRQSLVNAKLMERQGADYLFPQMAEMMFTPFGDGVAASNLNTALSQEGFDMGIWGAVKAAVLPGSYVSDVRSKIAAMAPQDRLVATQQLLSAIEQSSGWILTKDNDAVAIRQLQNYLAGDYTTTDVWVDNIFHVLDLVGLGMTIRSGRAALSGAQDVRTANKVSEVAEDVPTAPGSPGEVSLASIPAPRVSANASALQKAEQEYADTLSQVQTRLPEGAIRSMQEEIAAIRAQSAVNVQERAAELQRVNKLKAKDARTQAAKESRDAAAQADERIAALQNQIDINARSQAAQDKLPALEQRIESLRKSDSLVPAQLNPIADSIRRIDMNAVVRIDSPNAPANIFHSTNPQRVRQMFDAVMVSESDELAQVLFGSSRMEAVASATLPQIVTESGRVATKAPQADSVMRARMLEELNDAATKTGGIELTPKEMAQARAAVVNDFQSVTGMVPNDAMTAFSFDGTKVKVGAVYGTENGGWSTAEAAVEQAKYALRSRGIQDSEITVLQKQGLDHVPVSLEDVRGVQGDYRVRVDAEIDVSLGDVQEWDALTVKRNIFDRFPTLGKDSGGSLQRWVLDAASVLDPTITGSAIASTDRAAQLSKTMLDYMANFTDKYNKLPSDRKTMVLDYVKEANYKGLAQDMADLTARGFTSEERAALGDWKQFWDGHYYLENLDVIRTLRGNGFGKLSTANADLFVKPITKNSSRAKVYDPSLDEVRTLSQNELDELYNSGGTLAELRREESFDGISADTVIVRNSPDEYIRALRDNDTVLNYRDGYFQLTYKAPKFVEEVVRRPNGTIEYTRAIAVAGNTKDAERFAAQVAANEGKRFDPKAKGAARTLNDYNIRGDDRPIQRNSDSYWDLNSSGGRIAQRHRGQLLQDSTGMNHIGDATFIENPIDSGIRAATSVAGRTVTRPVIEAAKTRFVDQYKDLLPQDEYGRARWPRNRDEIKAKGVMTRKDLADAKTTFEYVNYLENGYINGLDNTAKAMIQLAANGFSKIGASRAESALNQLADFTNVSTLSKAAVFNAYIAANPLRQWIVQGHQIIRTVAYNPLGWASGEVPRLATMFYADLVKGQGDASEFGKFMRYTGALDSIDRNNLVRGTLSDAADSSNRVLNVARKPLDVVRKVGFDSGEHANLTGHGAAVFERYKRAGEDVTKTEVMAKMHSEMRALSWDMNFAGDMPYNQNSFSVALQFLQVPHKAITQTMNRRLSRADRLKLVSTDLVLWGAPLGLLSSVIPDDFLPDNPVLREALVAGVESAGLNSFLRMVGGGTTSVDFSSLAPYEMDGWTDFFEAIWSGGGVSDILANSPFGGLFLKDGGRMSDFIRTTSSYFTWGQGEVEDAPTLLGVMDKAARLSSGWNNIQKGRLMLKFGQSRDRFGTIVDEDVTQIEAYAQMLGFGTSDTKNYYETSIALSENAKEHSDQAKEAAKMVMEVYQSMNENDPDDVQRSIKLSQIIMSEYRDDPAGQEIMWNEVKSRMQSANYQIVRKLLAAAKRPDIDTLPDLIRMAPISDEQKSQAMQMVEDIKNVRVNPYYRTPE